MGGLYMTYKEIQRRFNLTQQLIRIKKLKRLRHKFSTIEGYLYCVKDYAKYKRELLEIDIALEYK